YWGCSQGDWPVFQVISSLHYSVVLGYPWLQRHNPTFDWRSLRFSHGLHSVGPVCNPLPFWATSFPLWDFPWTLRRFRRFCSGLVPVVFGPFSAFWDSPTIIGSLLGTFPHSGQ
ncbi:unnamed protein product, partial [Staurois parvus]